MNRAGRFRSLGDGQVDFGAIFSKLAAYDYDGWAVLEWECCLKHPEDGAAEGAPFIASHIIRDTEKAFDDFAGGQRRTTAQGHAGCSGSEGGAIMVSGRSDANTGRIRLGMVGGGQGAFIGAVHRLAARMDDQYELVAGALSSDPKKAKASARNWASTPDRIYATFAEMAKAEAKRADGIEAVSIVTPNHMHVPAAKAFLEAGIHVICDKPLALNAHGGEGAGEAAGQAART